MGVESDGESLVYQKSVILKQENDMRGSSEHLDHIVDRINMSLVFKNKDFSF